MEINAVIHARFKKRANPNREPDEQCQHESSYGENALRPGIDIR